VGEKRGAALRRCDLSPLASSPSALTTRPAPASPASNWSALSASRTGTPAAAAASPTVTTRSRLRIAPPTAERTSTGRDPDVTISASMISPSPASRRTARARRRRRPRVGGGARRERESIAATAVGRRRCGGAADAGPSVAGAATRVVAALIRGGKRVRSEGGGREGFFCHLPGGCGGKSADRTARGQGTPATAVSGRRVAEGARVLPGPSPPSPRREATAPRSPWHGVIASLAGRRPTGEGEGSGADAAAAAGGPPAGVSGPVGAGQRGVERRMRNS